MEVRVKRLHSNAIIPTVASAGDAGYDLFAIESVRIAPFERVAVDTGISLELPIGFVGVVWGKSGRALREGLTILGGVIDSSYRGAIKVIVFNASDKEILIESSSKVAQLLIQPVLSVPMMEADDLRVTARGANGFGSTGLKQKMMTSNIFSKKGL